MRSAETVLARIAEAVLGHGRAALAAQLATSARARTFRTRQLRELDNLRAVPLALWRYTTIGAIRDADAQRQADRRYGTPVLLLHVSLDYELAGVDEVPSSHDEYLSFVRGGDGRTVLAGDQALDLRGTPSWRGPWSYGALDAVRSGDVLVLGPRGESAALERLAAAVVRAVPAVTAVWGTDWSRRVAVIVPATEQEFTDVAGTVTVDVSAAAVTEGIDPVSGRAYGQRLVLDPDALRALSTIGEGIVLRHEITHLASAAATADITPRWLVEGLADYVGLLTTGQSVPAAAAELRTAVRAGRVPTHLPDDAAFATAGADVARVYEQSWLACRLIAGTVGQRGLVRFYRAVGTALAPRDQALAGGMRRVLRTTPARFTSAWIAYLDRELS